MSLEARVSQDVAADPALEFFASGFVCLVFLVVFLAVLDLLAVLVHLPGVLALGGRDGVGLRDVALAQVRHEGVDICKVQQNPSTTSILRYTLCH